MLESQKRSPLVLIASDGEWFARSLESVLELNGYLVHRSAGGSRAVEAAHRVRRTRFSLTMRTATCRRWEYVERYATIHFSTTVRRL
jgi:hypothetical protein